MDNNKQTQKRENTPNLSDEEYDMENEFSEQEKLEIAALVEEQSSCHDQPQPYDLGEASNIAADEQNSSSSDEHRLVIDEDPPLNEDIIELEDYDDDEEVAGNIILGPVMLEPQLLDMIVDPVEGYMPENDLLQENAEVENALVAERELRQFIRHNVTVQQARDFVAWFTSNGSRGVEFTGRLQNCLDIFNNDTDDV